MRQGRTLDHVPILRERRVCEVYDRQTDRQTDRQISQKNIFAGEMHSKIHVEWAAAHFDLGLT